MNWTNLRERLLGAKENNVQPPKLAIPSLPTVVMEFCRAAERPDISANELAQILDRDAGLVVELLRNINSATLGVRNKVNSSRAALSLLGIRRAKMFVLTSSVQSVSQKSKSPLADGRRFSFAAMQRAVFARRLADRLGHDAELAFAAALLQDFVVPALTVERPDRYRLLLTALTGDVASLADLERGRFGWDHSLAGARLMLSWGFPDDLVCLVLTQHWLTGILANPTFRDSELVEITLSSLLPDPLDARPSRQELLAQHLADLFGIDVPAFQEWIAEDLQYSGVAHDPTLAWTVRRTSPSAQGVRTTPEQPAAVTA